MGYYMLDHPPASRQFYPTRNAALTGGVGVHTTESIMDDVSLDTGAENVAGFIVRRSDPGSYACLVDSDSTVDMCPDYFTAFHIAASGHNSRTWGIAFACRTTDLDPDHWWTKAAFKRAAVAIVGFWRRNGFDPKMSNRWLPTGQTLSGPGLFHHGTAQPIDRTDAFSKHPRRDELAWLLSAEIEVARGAGVEPVFKKGLNMYDKVQLPNGTHAHVAIGQDKKVYLGLEGSDGMHWHLMQGNKTVDWCPKDDPGDFDQCIIKYRPADKRLEINAWNSALGFAATFFCTENFMNTGKWSPWSKQGVAIIAK